MSGLAAAPRSPWWTVVGAVCGLAAGNGPVMQFSFGVFLIPLVTAFQTDRGTISAALLIALCVTGVATPMLGRLIDRFGTRAVTLPAIVLFAAGIGALGLAQTAVQFIILYSLVGIVAAAQTPLPYARAVAGTFEKRRGLALGISMAGVGIGTALLPQLAQALIAGFGWRTAYMVFGTVIFVLAFPAMAFLVAGPRAEASQVQSAAAAGMRASEARRTGTFAILAVSFFCSSAVMAGVIAHIIPLLIDVGVPPAVATSTLGAVGFALIAGRLLSGFMLDRIYAPYVALMFFLTPLAGILLLVMSASVPAAFVAVLLVGLGVGAEVDLMAYLISRYFGMRAFGEIYGYLFAVFMFGSGIGPFLLGVGYRWSGTYTPALLVFAAVLAFASVLILRLGAYAFGGRAISGSVASSA